MGSIPGSGRSPGGRHGNPLQYSYLEYSMEPGRLQSMELQSVRHDWACMHTCKYKVNLVRAIYSFVHFLLLLIFFNQLKYNQFILLLSGRTTLRRTLPDFLSFIHGDHQRRLCHRPFFASLAKIKWANKPNTLSLHALHECQGLIFPFFIFYILQTHAAK